jgi:hypothetical protein
VNHSHCQQEVQTTISTTSHPAASFLLNSDNIVNHLLQQLGVNKKTEKPIKPKKTKKNN